MVIFYINISGMCRYSTGLLVVLSSVVLMQGAMALEFTVYTTAQFTNALLVAATNGENDTVSVIAGYYALESDAVFDSSEPHSLYIRNRYGNVTVDGGGSHRTLYIYSHANDTNAWIRTSGLTFQNGFVNNDTGANVFIRTQRGNIFIEKCCFNNGHSGSLYGSSHAAGLFARADNAGSTTIQRCTFTNNTAKGDGGGCYMIGENLVLENSVFADNEGAARGGGAYIYSVSGNITARNNTFVRNTTGGTGYGGGGLHVAFYYNGGSAAILNNIAWTNNADNGLGKDIFIEDDVYGDGTGTTVIVEGNLYSDLDYHVGDNISSGSNINSNPLLHENYHLQADSPCIDTGTNYSDSTWDRVNVSRPLDGNMDGAPHMDIGAFEYVPITALSTGITACWELLYTSSNLLTHGISAESNPGDPTTNFPAGLDDVTIVAFPAHGEVTSNVRKTNVYVNAIGYKRFEDTFPDGSPVGLDVFKYKVDVRLPVIPVADILQTQNAQTVQMLIQMWDGTNRVWQANKHAIEATSYWSLGPWESNYLGNVMVYTDTTGALEVVETGITVPPDTNWHRFEMVADFANRKWVSIRVDDQVADISSITVPLLLRTNWGSEVLYHITQESCATYPGPGYLNVFSWTTEFKDIEFYRLKFYVDDAGQGNAEGLDIQWHGEPFMKYQIKGSSDLTSWSPISEIMAGGGTNLRYTVSTTNAECGFYRIGIN